MSGNYKLGGVYSRKIHGQGHKEEKKSRPTSLASVV